jgi:hypothetical protein
MILQGASHRSRLKHHGRRIVVRERHQRPRVGDLGTKWKIFYWDYSSGTRRGRTKSWAKGLVPTRTEAQRLADQFMETANGRNNEPQLFPSGEETMAGLVAICREKMWPLLKNSTRISYDFYLDTYLLPKWGSMKLTKMRTIELQDFFNSLPLGWLQRRSVICTAVREFMPTPPVPAAMWPCPLNPYPITECIS